MRDGVVMTSDSIKTIKLDNESFELTAAEASEWFAYGAIRVSVPPGSRLVLCLPFAAARRNTKSRWRS